MCGSPGAGPMRPAVDLALSLVHKSAITQQAVHDSGFIQSDHLAYSNDLTPSNYCLFRNVKSYVRASIVHDTV